MLQEYEFQTVEEAARNLADQLAMVLRQAISERGRAVIAVSGGQTPRFVFEKLRESAVDWSRVTVTLTDERWVSPDESQSNEHLVRSFLGVDLAVGLTFVPLFGGEDSPEAGRKACESRLESLDLPFDAVYLGMGSDGHVASLFPGEASIGETDDLCVPVPSVDSRLARMSLTLPTLLESRQIFLLYSGPEKHAAYVRAKEPGKVNAEPLRAILEQKNVALTVLRAL